MSSTADQLEMQPLDLARQLESGADLQLLDVRAPERLAGGYIDIGPPERFLNVRGSEVRALRDPAQAGLDPALPVVTICGHGNSSSEVAAHLAAHGYQVRSLTGGMAAWMNLLLPRELKAPQLFDRLVQFDRIGKGALSYLLVSRREAFAIDVPRDTTAIEAAAAESRAQIVGVADTHAHADYISGGPGLAERLGVPYHLHPADAVSPFDGRRGTLRYKPLENAKVIKVGRGQLLALHTPGHTAGSVSLAVSNAMLSGDFLFVNSVGRSDLADRTAEWSADLYESVLRARRAWTRNARVYPAHYASDAERNTDRSVGKLMGELLSTNPALRFNDRDSFRAWIEASLKAPPDSYRKIKLINIGLRFAAPAELEELESGRNECALSSSTK